MATNLYLYPTWKRADGAAWKKALSLLISRNVIGATGEGTDESELWFSPGKRPEHVLKIGGKEAFEDCRVHNGNEYLIPDGDTGGFGAKCPGCGKALEDALVAEAITDHNEADSEDDRTACPKCKSVIDVEKLSFQIETALAPSFLCFVNVPSAVPNPELMKALEEATGTPWKSLTEKVDL